MNNCRDKIFQLSFPDPEFKLEFTGERYVSGLTGQIQHEHYHRYLFASRYSVDRIVFDIACGEGYGCHLLAQVASRVIGGDVDIDTIRYAESQYSSPKLKFVACNATAIPLNTASVDVVTSFETIEHFQNHETFLAEIARILRPDGLLIISSPNHPVYTAQDKYENPYHIREVDREQFRSALLAQFPNVTIFEQRPIHGSVIVAEGSHKAAVEGFQSADGLNYSQDDGVPNPPFFVAIASSSRLPKIRNSVLFNDAYLPRLQCSIAEEQKRAAAAVEDTASQRLSLEYLLGQRDNQLAKAHKEISALQQIMAQERKVEFKSPFY